jgi:hypothetical protein
MDILISTRHVNLLRRYSAKTGISIDLCVHYALTEWFGKDASSTLAQLSLPDSTQVGGGHSLIASSRVACNDSDSGGIVRRIKSLLRYGTT